MNISGTPYRSLWPEPNGIVRIIDQSRLPFEFVIAELRSLEAAADAIRSMRVRGAPLIGVMAAYGVALAAREGAADAELEHAAALLQATRPTAANLVWALRRMRRILEPLPVADRADAAWREAAAIAEDDVAQCRAIGGHGRIVLQTLAEAAGRRLNILTHCNAGWLAAVDWGTALAPVYAAHDSGCEVHVWVDETRPRNQGASLTAFELGAHGVPHTVIADSLGGHLMQHGRVDVVLVGSDRTTAGGDVCNKVGTYLKALAAHDNGLPFYAALPLSSMDWSLDTGREIPIEQRSAAELTHVTGRTAAGAIETVQVVPDGSPALNLAFDVTPARLVTGLITERGLCTATRAGLRSLHPEGGSGG